MDRRNKKPNKRRYRNRLSPIQRILRVFKIGGMVVIGAAGALGMSVGFIFVYDLITQAEVFSAQKIRIEGIRRLARADIFRQAQLKKGINIFSVNLPHTRKRLLSHPWMSSGLSFQDSNSVYVLRFPCVWTLLQLKKGSHAFGKTRDFRNNVQFEAKCRCYSKALAFATTFSTVKP